MCINFLKVTLQQMTLFPGPKRAPHRRLHLLKAHNSPQHPHSSVWKKYIKTVPNSQTAWVMQCGYKWVTLDLEHTDRHEYRGPKLGRKEALDTTPTKEQYWSQFHSYKGLLNWWKEKSFYNQPPPALPPGWKRRGHGEGRKRGKSRHISPERSLGF